MTPAAARRAGGPAEQRFAGFRQRLVAADMVRVGTGIDDVANGLGRDPLDGGQHGRGAGRRSGVHDHHAVVAHLHADVAAGAGDDEEVVPDGQHLDAARWGRRLGARRRQSGQRHQKGNDSSHRTAPASAIVAQLVAAAEMN